MRKLKYPIGISDFAEMCNNGYYYIDKTNVIVDLLDKGPVEVTQITRPRRFGKSLGMSTLANFLDIRKDSKQLLSEFSTAKKIRIDNGTYVDARLLTLKRSCLTEYEDSD